MSETVKIEPKSVYFISLGCARNRVDTEVMLGSFLQQGWQVTDNQTSANVVVINTCGFIGPAKKESINEIIDAGETKAGSPGQKLVVTGCLTQRYKSQLAKGLPEVDLFIGTDEFPKIVDYVTNEALPRGSVKAARSNYLFAGELPKKNTLSSHAAYVKVAEGCQHNCSFCIIPAIRGPLRSRPIASIIREVQSLVASGIVEINLIAQDLAAFGREQDDDEYNLLKLLKELEHIEGLLWVRLLYVYPENITDEFLEFFASSSKIVKYLDIPIQHASNTILASMNRDVTREQLISTIRKVRSQVPGVAIRTSVMVGFPGETEEDFEELIAFVRDMKFEHLGCFTYSKEEGTVAGRMPNQIEESVKIARQQAVMALQKEISQANLSSYKSKTVEVLITGPSEETELLLCGRLSTQAPEVDGMVYLNEGTAEAGEIRQVLITETHDYDMVGTIQPH